ncbi:DNA-binding transcriptional regulator LsrR (DeoR family) [Geomicrobium halophilum]|uniref:DNA-binding transcriptional regulator LsrR (DeoR family) n=1 Tax=Geomicrobium halophilum TaxID=549000 RepID=A0A841PX05_9BACL|nr:sugar-binding transcriptional regulator [Geomicrobium halophilum]MBB6451111.1 DNA-binding transcriptional regulator LsrR (DeoR family) [Geomicrobium halophilum]
MNWNEERNLIMVSKMYYEEALTQNEISKQLGIYRTTITRMLQKAREEGIVRIEVVESNRVKVDLERRLKEKFGSIQEFIVVPVNAESTRSSRLKAVGNVAISLLDSILKEGDNVGLAWGETMGTMANLIERKRKIDADFVPIVGGPGKMRVEHHVNTIAYNFAKAYHSRAHYIDSAAIVQSKETRDEIMGSEYMRDVLKLWDKLTVAIIGIGAPIRSSNLVWAGFLENGEDQMLEKDKAVGDIGSRFYNIDGLETTASLQERTIAIELDRLKENRATIAVAESEEKLESIVGAINGGYISHLVIDEPTAEALIRREG